MSFDAVAPYYRWMEFLLAGEILQHGRTAFLGSIPPAKKILILGEGNGRFLLECRRMFPEANITSVDSSARMISLARRRLMGQGMDCDGIEFIHADALTWTPAVGGFDLIVTHFFLDCFRADQLQPLIARLALAAAPRANWLLADFQTAEAGLPRQRSRLIVWGLYRFFRVMTRLSAAELASPDAFITRQGFTLREREVYDWGLLRSDWWQRVEQPA
jgi:ubiquinone/menaquinone biosynthesis C-methylase UbiE